VGSERGLVNWPARRDIFTTGMPPAKVSATAICSRTRNVSRIVLALNSAKLSAQSPPWSRKALPLATLASSDFSRRASRQRPAAAWRQASSRRRQARLIRIIRLLLDRFVRQVSGVQRSPMIVSVH